MSNDDSPDYEPMKKKRKRTVIPPSHAERLENLFCLEQWPNRARKEALAKELGHTEHFVSVWFQNRRARYKKEEVIARHVGNFKGFRNVCIHPNIDSSALPETRNKSVNSEAIVSKKGPSKNNGNGHIKSSETEPYMKKISLDGESKVIYKKQLPEKKIMKILIKPKLYGDRKMCNQQHHSETVQPKQDTAAVFKRDGTEHTKTGVTFFEAVINMMCIVERGILDIKDPQYSSAVNNALYGICINGDSRLTYDKQTGLKVQPLAGNI